MSLPALSEWLHVAMTELCFGELVGALTSIASIKAVGAFALGILCDIHCLWVGRMRVPVLHPHPGLVVSDGARPYAHLRVPARRCGRSSTRSVSCRRMRRKTGTHP